MTDAPLKVLRIALMGDIDLASALAHALERRRFHTDLAVVLTADLEPADLLVQLDNCPPSPGAIDAALAKARTLGAKRILVFRQGISLAEMPDGETAGAEPGIAISILHLPKILIVPRRSGQGIARSALAAVWPAMFVSDVADVVAQIASGAGLYSAAFPRGGTALHAFVMRLADILVGLSVLTLASPVLLGLGLAVRSDSPGPAIFTQRRVGQREKPFTLFKFRTMAVGTRQVGTHEVTAASVTRLGVILRHYKLDELPQAWNLLVGDLTLVGPRPCLPVQQELVCARRLRGVYGIKPGVTGLAQVQGIDMSEPVRLAAIDAAYVATRGIALDLALLARTFFGAGKGDRVAVAPPR